MQYFVPIAAILHRKCFVGSRITACATLAIREGTERLLVGSCRVEVENTVDYLFVDSNVQALVLNENISDSNVACMWSLKPRLRHAIGPAVLRNNVDNNIESALCTGKSGKCMTAMLP